LKQELVEFARHAGLATSGDKPSLADRVASFLGGEDPHVEAKPERKMISRRLAEPLSLTTLLGPRQASSQQLRRFFVGAIGPQFSFDVHMRTFLASENEKTIEEAVAHWHATRHVAKPETLPQLELVRFTRAWHRANPDGTQLECRAAWKQYKALPADERSPPPGM
jgi:hypothetical protein